MKVEKLTAVLKYKEERTSSGPNVKWIGEFGVRYLIRYQYFLLSLYYKVSPSQMFFLA